ncbi:aldo-keto reductase family 1 member B1-like [Branchiostoma lanceolatum]|uniref:aldo-keto reductase family 1 member B1-like n=1 Tax=Branchiostoma lanceolatum TaxID=7740 RepID=UPI0034561B88
MGCSGSKGEAHGPSNSSGTTSTSDIQRGTTGKMTCPAVKLSTGASMPQVGLGTWQSKENECYEAVKAALEAGYRHIDTAELYQNEKEIGRALKEKMDAGVAREEIFVVSKLWNTRHHPDDVLPACQKSLDDLGLKYLDLYLMHLPIPWARGDNLLPLNEDGKAEHFDVHFMETWKAMENLLDAGLVKAIGVSNFNISQMEEVLTNGKIKPAVNQIESHPYLTCNRMLEFCKENGVVMTAYCPLGAPGGNGIADHGFAVLEDPELKKIAENHGKTVAQVCLRWQVQRGVVVIPKSLRAARMVENSQIFDFELSAGDVETINNLNRDGRVYKWEWSKDHPQWPFNEKF